MVGTKIAVLLQATVFLSGVTARCLQNCPADDPLLVLLRSDDTATAFCSDFLGLPVSTVDATVTPTVIATVAETDYVTEVVTEIESTTVTVSAAGPTTSFTAVKRAAPLPSWLPTSYGPKYISKACSCLSISPSVSTLTETAEPVTITQPVTTTATTTTTVISTAIATETAAPPPPVTKRVYIEVLRKDTGATVGYLYNSNGPAVSETIPRALPVTFTLPGGVTTASQLRITGDGLAPSALGFLKDSNPSNIVELEDGYGTLAWREPTPPGSKPAANDNSSYKWETDIWTVNTETREIGAQWIATSGALPTISLWRNAGRIYPVGNLEKFLYASSNGPTQSRYEIVLKYIQIAI